jgi:hypothetical protein
MAARSSHTAADVPFPASAAFVHPTQLSRRPRLKKHTRRNPPPVPVVDGVPVLEIEARDAATLPAIIAGAFERINIRLRARMLGRLLASVGPLALTVVGGGAFAKYVAQARWPEIPVSFEDAARATSSQVHELVRYVQQSNPQLVGQLLDVLARDTATIAALGASVAALTLQRLSAAKANREPR